MKTAKGDQRNSDKRAKEAVVTCERVVNSEKACAEHSVSVMREHYKALSERLFQDQEGNTQRKLDAQEMKHQLQLSNLRQKLQEAKEDVLSQESIAAELHAQNVSLRRDLSSEEVKNKSTEREMKRMKNVLEKQNQKEQWSLAQGHRQEKKANVIQIKTLHSEIRSKNKQVRKAENMKRDAKKSARQRLERNEKLSDDVAELKEMLRASENKRLVNKRKAC